MIFRYGDKFIDILNGVQPECSEYGGEIEDDIIVYQFFKIPKADYTEVKAIIPECTELNYYDIKKYYDKCVELDQGKNGIFYTSVFLTDYVNSDDYIKAIIADIGDSIGADKNDSQLGSFEQKSVDSVSDKTSDELNKDKLKNELNLKESTQHKCDSCNAELDDYVELINSYGEHLCDDCWDAYINSERGKVEYFIDICEDPSDIDFYDAADLASFADSWKNHKDELTLTSAEIARIESAAKALKLL